MKFAYINYYFDKDIKPEEYFEKYPTVKGWCDSVSAAGFEVLVFQRFPINYSFKKDNVEYFFIKDDQPNYLRSWNISYKFHNAILQKKPDIIQVNGFDYIIGAYLLKRKSHITKVFIQHHAEKPWRSIKRYLQRYLSGRIDGFIFSSYGIYDYWVKKKAIPADKTFGEIIENSSGFYKIDREEARRQTGITGNPALLWVGRLNDNKDPLSVLKGFNLFIQDYKNAKLYMIYSENDLENKVKEYINRNKLLKESIVLLGKRQHKELLNYYCSADYFLSASHYEGTGYSVIEAMACGLIPIITEIHPFISFTNKGEIGEIWKPGDSESFYRALIKIIGKEKNKESEKVLDKFNTEYSYKALTLKIGRFIQKLTGNQI